MAKSFDKLRDRMSPVARRRAEALTAELASELPLQELRQALALTQEELAETLGVRQATISKLERRTDMYISTLARFVEAMGGQLELMARFPEGEVRITSLKKLDDDQNVAAG